jgi:hypothetical protein
LLPVRTSAAIADVVRAERTGLPATVNHLVLARPLQRHAERAAQLWKP